MKFTERSEGEHNVVTDDDVKRLKHNHSKCAELAKRCIICDLLARLEAAEMLCDLAEIEVDNSLPEEVYYSNALKVWHKSKGE